MAALYRDDKKLKLKIAYSNFSAKESADYRDLERRIGTLDELAYEFAENLTDFGAESALTVSGDMFEELTTDADVRLPDDMLPENIHYAETYRQLHSAFDKAYLAGAVAEELASRYGIREYLPPLYRRGNEISENRISYVHNPYSDVACELFSELMENPLVTYADSFRDACEALHEGEARYAILPLGNSADHRIGSFYSLIDSFNLKICASVRVSHNDSDEVTLFGLLTLAPPELFDRGGNTGFMELKFNSHSVKIDNILTAARVYGLYCNDVVLSPSDFGGVVYVSLSGDIDRFDHMRAYIAAFENSVIIIGIYKEINNTEV